MQPAPLLRNPLFCVSTVSIVCTKAPVPVRAEDGLDPLQSIVADAADGTDGVMQLVLAYGRYPDCARSQPPLAAEDNFNPKCPEAVSYTHLTLPTILLV